MCTASHSTLFNLNILFWLFGGRVQRYLFPFYHSIFEAMTLHVNTMEIVEIELFTLVFDRFRQKVEEFKFKGI